MAVRTATMAQAAKFFAVGDKHEYDAERSASERALFLPRRKAHTGIQVLIVGAGFAGLTAALECWRNGHKVVGILERNQCPNYSG